MSLLFELSPSLKSQIDNLQPTAGYCIFIDSVGSTALKDNEPRVWLSRLYDIFALAKAYLKEFQPLKTIGDALMYYIAEDELKFSVGPKSRSHTAKTPTASPLSGVLRIFTAETSIFRPVFCLLLNPGRS